MMNGYEIKFKFDIGNMDKGQLDKSFKKIGNTLSVQFDENYDVYHADAESAYQFMDVSNQTGENIEKITDDFFTFTFDDIIDVPLYRFLVLKNNQEITVLANIHSSIFDYSSVNKFYDAFVELDDASLEDNVIAHHRAVSDYLNSSDFENDSLYWKKHFLNIGEYLRFHNVKSKNCKSIKVLVDNPTLSDFLSEHNISKFNFITAIFSLYLSRIDRTKGCLLKTLIPKNNNNLGFFDKKSMLKIEYLENNSFADYLAEVEDVYNLAAEHTKVDIDNYFDKELSYYSIFDFTDLEDVTVINGEGSALALNVYNDYLELIYDSDLFSEVYIQHMADNIESLAGNVVEAPDQIVKDINILSGSEQALLSDYCRGKTVDVDKEKMFATAFREYAIDHPDAMAIDDGVNQVTYGELERSSNSIANDLKENYGIGLSSRVALLLPRTYHFPELTLALNKIGATFIPLDLFYPPKRIEYMLKISQAECIITTRQIAKSQGLENKAICIEDLNADDDVEVDIVTRIDDLFSIIFTSGTTGLPKGVMVSNRQVPTVGTAFKEIFNYSAGDTIGNYLSFTFAASFVIYAALYFGGCCRIFNEKEQRDSLVLVRELTTKHMNSLVLPPMVGVPIFEKVDMQLDYLVLGGAKLNELSRRERRTKVVNYYGTTEILCAVAKVYDLKHLKGNNVPIGRPTANSWIYILDDDANQMPIGVPGEICVAHDYMSPGYINNPELTAEVFVENPYCTCEDNKRIYRTGDIGFYNFDGEIEIIGREDDQLSVGGFRIESNEIMGIMMSFPAVSNIFLDGDNDILTAYYTTEGDVNIDDVKMALKNELPYYMIPSLFVEVEEIPLNLNGKVNKEALKEMLKVHSDINIEDEVLSVVLDAFKEVLGTDNVLIDSDFVELGGNSLSAMNLQMLLKERLDVNLHSNEIIELSTPSDIANHIKYNLDIHSSIDVNYTFDELCPLSESQLNVYLDETVNDMGTGYNNPFKLELNNNHSVEDIKNAIGKLFEVYPVLSARVVDDNGILSFSFDAMPEIQVGLAKDMESFVRPFGLDKSLSRFLIVEESDSTVICGDFHHLILDGTSLSIMLNQLTGILEDGEVDFVDDGVLRQISFEENLPSDYIDAAKEFFDVMLSDRDECYDLLPSVNNHTNSNIEYVSTFNLDNGYLNSFLQNHHVTHNQFFTGIFAYTLSRFTGSSKVLFNIIEDGRGHIDLSKSVGMFVRTLPLIIDCKNQNVGSFLKNSSDLVNSVMKYDLYPFRLLAKEYDINPSIMFQYSHDLFYNALNMDESGYGVEELAHDVQGDLSFYIFNVGENEMGIRITYSDKYCDDFIKKFADSFVLVLQDMAQVSELSEIGYTSPDDFAAVDEFNRTEHGLEHEDILEAFNDNLLQYRDDMLVSMDGRSYSYGEGAFIANEISKRLIELGVESQDCVSFFVQRSEYYIFSILGIMSVGAVYVPLDDTHPDSRIQFMLEDTKSKVVIVSDETRKRAESLTDDCIILNISDILDGDVGNLSGLDIVGGDLACILYTSGTTGVPKGVEITRKSILNLSEFYLRNFDLTHGDVYALFASIGFDVAIKAIFPSLLAGACINIVPNEIRLDIDALNDYFMEHNVTHTEITTQIARLFIGQIDNTSLKVLTTGGEKFGENKINVNYRFADSYGPTEACVDVTSIDMEDRIDYSSVGHLIDNVKAYVLDAEKRSVPVGAVGELYLAGYPVSKGYLNREEETNNAFIKNPFSDDENYGVLYRTGDMVRFLPDGSLGIVGRLDSQVKIRGNRVELSEVESVIRDIGIVEDVTVQAVRNANNYELVAYVVADQKNSNLKDCISDHVNKNKPEYMVPSFIIPLDEIPLTVNGKVNKKALPGVDFDGLKRGYVAPTNDTEKIIVQSFEEVFDIKQVGLFDDFVRLGGDSILAIRIISLLGEKGISCSARDILNYKTPYLIAQHVVDNVEKVSYDAVEGIVDLLPIQEEFFDQVNSNNYTQEFVLKANMDLDIELLQRTLDELSNIHDMLRARYRFDDDDIVQEILPLNTRVCEIKEHHISDNLNECLLGIMGSSVNSIDMTNHLIDVNLIHYNGESYLTFVLHHLIVDGISWNILLVDLTYIYFRLGAGKEIELTRPYPYKHWIQDVKNLVADISPTEKQHWLDVNNLLDDSKIRGKTHVFALNADNYYDVDNLLMLSEEEYLALAIARAYKRTYGEDIIFNRESYGRDESLADLNRTVGWFTSQYPIPVVISNRRDNVSLMNDVYEIKTAFKDIKNLGLNYASLIYTTHELEYRHCPVTFNFLSNEFVFKNELFESMNMYLSQRGEIDSDIFDSESYGITFNIAHEGDSYIINGDYASGTYIGNEFNSFIDNIKSELEFLGNYSFEDEGIVCCLSETQLGIYLDERVNDKGTAYSVFDILECADHSIDEIEIAIHTLIDKYPILKGRILNNKDSPLLICDAYPAIEVVDEIDYGKFIRPFDLDKSLVRFFIVDDAHGKSVFYDMHHIICDATSEGIFREAFERALNGELGDGCDLGFVYASRDSFESKFDYRYENAKKFFNDEFAGIDDVQLLLDDVDGSKGSVSLPIRGIRSSVESFAHENGITVASLLNSVFAYAYSRFTGSEKVYYTFTGHGRHQDYAQDALSMFVQTIPIVVDCKNTSVESYVGEVSELILESMSNSIYPFRLVAAEFNLTNNVCFEYNFDLNDVSGIGDEIVFNDNADGVNDFLCVVNDLEDGFVVSVTHLDRFSQGTAERFVNVFKEILIQFLDKDELADIEYISDDDVRLLDGYNQTECDFEYCDILDAFNDNLSEYENADLVVYGNNGYTHGEVAFIANEIADRLIELNVGRQNSVSLFVPRSEWFLLAPMGVLSMGGVYVPIDTDFPDERIILMLKDSGSKVVIVSDHTEQRMLKIILDNDLDIGVLNVSEITDKDIGSLNHLNTSDLEEKDIGCLLYTSGTTGTPKGVLVTRKAMNNFVSWYVKETDFTSSDVYGMYCSYVFDMHTHALYSPVITGGSLNVIPKDVRLNLKALNDYFVNHNCTHTYITSQVGKLFAESGMKTTIKLLCFGGMKLGELNAPDSIGPFESYGPSENLAISTSIFANKRMHHSSIGHFISNVKGYVLDGEHRRVSIGAVGELYLAGHQLTPGYLNRCGENEEAFFDNPFDDEQGYETIYRTGDIVRFLPDGTLGIVGRSDGQVKIRGNRVELTEVESTIRDMDFVEDVTVQTVDNDGNNELVAYLVLNKEVSEENNIGDCVRDHVGEHKPDYMIPSYVIQLDNIPLTINGKVDKKALPEFDLGSFRVEYVAPRTEAEKDIVRAFEKVFHQERIGIYDEFIRLGGDSLTAIKLLSYLENYNISVADVLCLQTPYAIAKNIRDVFKDLDLYSLDSGCPLSESQLNVYLDIMANEKGDAYIIPLFMELSRDYDIEDVVQALNDMFAAHPILRMRVSEEFEVPYLVKGHMPSVLVESDEDGDFIGEFLVSRFDLNDSLCRFLIIDGEDSYGLYAAFHHIIFDALSSAIFKRDLQAILDGKYIDMEDSFLKVSAFSQKIVETEEYGEAHNFYRDMLADSEDVGILLDSVLPDGPGTLHKDLDINTKLFNSFLQNYNIGENVLFTSIFAYTLSRFAGSDKILFNIVENGRDRFSNFNSIGMYVNTLPLVVDCKNDNVSSFMDYVSNVVYDVMRYNYYPFRLLSKEFGCDSNILFQFLPDWIDADEGGIEKIDYDDLDYFVEGMDKLIADLTVEVIQNGDNYCLNILYSDKYSKDFINRFAESYKLVLSQFIYDTSQLSDVKYVPRQDLELLNEINKTECSLDYDDIMEAFNYNLLKSPEGKLVSYNDISYSYEEGAYIADNIASQLTDLDIGPQDVVGFLVERSELYMFCALGIMSMGGVQVPLDDKLPDESLKFILNDSCASVVIVSDETYGRARNLSDNMSVLNISDILKDDVGTLSNLPVVNGDLACILYTSGSTGVPKGVKITRKSVLNQAAYYVDTYGFGNDDVYGLYSSIGFDAGPQAIFQTIYAGACLAVIPEDIKFNILELNEYFINLNVSHTFMSTQVAKLFMKTVDSTSLKSLSVGGESLGEVKSPENYKLVDEYGPTEAFAFISSMDNSDKIHSSSIGHLNFNSKSYILDNEFRRVSIGAVGELFLSGVQISEGYLNRDEENAEAFLKNPFSNKKDYEIMYRTGDMVRLLPDGSLGLVGRRDSQVKIRGNRVELSEVESAIRNIDAIEDVTVQTVDNDGNNELVAYVVSSEDIGDLRDLVCDYVSEHKPKYMVPSYVMELDCIPLTINNKVDKDALPQVDVDSLREAYAAPTNETEKDIVLAFENVFGREGIGINDDFIVLGGDSLSAIKLLSYLEGYNITVGEILSLGTPYKIAKSIKKHSLDLDIYSLESGCPLNEPQLNVYLDIIANDKGNAYIIPSFIGIFSDYGVDELYGALEKMFRVHPILGMCVSDDYDVPYLVKGSKPSILLKSDADDEFIREFSSSPFDLHDSLCRFLIVDDESSYRLYAVFHHLIFDALSDIVFRQDLHAILDGESIEIDDSFLDVAAFSQQIKETDEYRDAHNFYESIFVDSDETGVLLDSVLPDGPGRLQLNLDLDFNLFKSFLQNYNISENVLFTSVFAYTLSRFVGRDRVLFNIVENGRDRFNNFSSIGMYVNTLPLLLDCKNSKVSSFMDYVSEVIYDVMKFNYYPFRLLAKEYDVNSNIFFQFMPDLVETDNMLEDNKLIVGNDFISDLSVDVVQHGDSYSLNISYSDKYSKEFINRFAESYKLILSQIIRVDELSDIGFVSKSDLELLDDINKTERFLAYGDVLDVFNDNLNKWPDNKLVSFNDRSYSYAEGAFIADTIAKKLSELGVSSSECVAFLTERCEYYMFSVLGIMSMGGVYVPLDVNLPDERLRFMLRDSDAGVVIVSDETYARAGDLSPDISILNISEILKEGIETLSSLNAVHGDLACILYTSGTTGVPKGVKITRKAILNLCENYVSKNSLNESDVYGLFASIGFDAASQAICQTFYAGACLSVIPEDIRFNMKKMNKYMVEQGITHTMLTTQVGKLFMEHIDDTSLKVLTVGGEKLGEFESPDNYKLIDGFGPTETFAFITSIENIDKVDSSSIGFLNYNTKAYILDNELRQVSHGAVGELYLAGNQIAAGYLNDENETDKAFIDNPFSSDDDYSVLYRTGDMVRLLPDDSLGLVGRRDSQVKIRGNRVELPEIESIIREMDYIKDVSVQAIENNGDTELVAYVVASGEYDGVEADINEHILNNYPEFMVPSFIMTLDSIPLTVNGKVDKHSLPKLDLDSRISEYVASANETERAIVEAFEKVFGYEKLGVHDSFSHLGGDSLTAIRLLSYLDDCNITVADILSLQTPREIARNVKDIQFDMDVYSLDTGCPLSEPQLNVYLDIVANDKQDSYLIPLFMEISKEYGVDKLVDALDTMLNLHPILKMSVSDEFEVPYLLEKCPPTIIKKSDVSDDFISEFLTKPFDLHESLSRFLIVENNDSYRLIAVFHHIIFDALSEVVFKRDLQSILDGESVEMDDSFLRVSAFNSQIKDSDDYADAGDFYEAMLVECDDAGILLDSIGAGGPGSKEISLDLDNDLFKSFLTDYGISENVFFTGAFAYALSRFVGSEKVLFNIVENGRDRFNNYDSIGMYVNTLPLVVDCKNRDISSFMEYMSDLVYDVMRYNYYPFRLLANKYGINSNILFQFLPDWINEGDNLLCENAEKEDMKDLITDLNVDVVQKANNYSLSIYYSERYSPDFISHFMESYKLILQDLLKVNELSEINYILKSDLDILNGYNQNEIAFEHTDVLDAFNSTLPIYENDTLVGYKDDSYTHGESAYIANELAGRLTEMGVVKQDCVALFVDRSVWSLLACMGVLSMGGIYVPVDTSYPDERILLMLNDTSSRAVIVDDNNEQRIRHLIEDNDLDIDVLNVSSIIEGDISSLNHLDAEDIDGNDVACVLYTSGTTGTPNGSLITRKAVNNFVSWYVRETDFTSDDVYGMHCSYVFDIHTAALFAPIITGGSLYIVPEEIRLDLTALNEYYVEHNCTHTYITSQVGKLFAESGMETTIKLLCFGGMKLGELNAPDSIGPFETYGPSENLAVSTSIFANKRIHHSSIGRFISNVKGYVLDTEHRRVPLGAVGELYLAGHQLAKGYLNRIDENNKSFFENPFDDSEGYEHIYKTGDIVRFLPDGTLGIVGRRDSQVKVRGNRVELTEVESVIRSMDVIEDVTVQIIENNGNNELIAYVVSSKGFVPDDIRDVVCGYVAERKPDYMVPSFVVELDEIPLNVNGKVDVDALPEVDFDSLKGIYVPPKTELERKIVKSFETVFNQENIGLFDDFVRLGGDSLTAIRIKSILGIDFDVRIILKDRTPFKIAKSIGEDKREYGFELIREGSEDKNMFLLPPQGGASFIFIPLVNSLEFKGNVYLIDDFKYDLTIDEIRNVEDNHNLILNHYYDAIKDIFRDGDIIAGYSLGCIYGALLAEKLEQTKKVGKCILIDGPLDFTNNEPMPRVDNIDDILEYDSAYKGMAEEYVRDFKDRIIEIYDVNSTWQFNTPKLNSHVVYLGTRDKYKESIKDISDDYEFILVDSTHHDLIGNDVDKIVKYFK